MCAKWINGVDRAPLLRRINDLAAVEDGKVKFHNTFEAQEYRAVILSAVEMHPDVPHEARRRLAHTALVQTLREKSFDPGISLRNAAEQERAYLRKPRTRYTLVGSISIEPTTKLAPRTIDGVTVRFHSRPPSNFDRSRMARHIEVTFENRPLPNNYLWFTAVCEARTPHEAGERSLRAIDVVRSLWNFTINRYRGTTYFAGRPKPVNQILLGPISTIHDETGQMPDDEYWYDQSYHSAARPYEWKRELVSHERALLRKLAQHPYRRTLEECLRRYNSACDTDAYNAGFIDLWSVLELLTGTTGRKYELLVKRASSLDENAELHAALLDHLRHYRNDIVHHARSSRDSSDHIHLLRRYVQRMILFHLYQSRARPLRWPPKVNTGV